MAVSPRLQRLAHHYKVPQVERPVRPEMMRHDAQASALLYAQPTLAR